MVFRYASVFFLLKFTFYVKNIVIFRSTALFLLLVLCVIEAVPSAALALVQISIKKLLVVVNDLLIYACVKVDPLLIKVLEPRY